MKTSDRACEFIVQAPGRCQIKRDIALATKPRRHFFFTATKICCTISAIDSSNPRTRSEPRYRCFTIIERLQSFLFQTGYEYWLLLELRPTTFKSSVAMCLRTLPRIGLNFRGYNALRENYSTSTSHTGVTPYNVPRGIASGGRKLYVR